MKNAQAKIKELRQVTNDYVDDSMKRTEEAIAQALSEIRESRSKFRALVNPQQAKPSPIIEDVKRISFPYRYKLRRGMNFAQRRREEAAGVSFRKAEVPVASELPG